MNWLDSDLLHSRPAQPNQLPQPEPILRGNRERGFFDGFWTALGIAAVAFAVFLYASRERNDDGDQIDVERFAVLILEETANRDQLSVGQLAAIQSTKIRETIRSKRGELRVLDVDDNVETLAEPWPTLRRRATLKPPLVVMAANGRAVEFALPDAETLQKRIEDFQ